MEGFLSRCDINFLLNRFMFRSGSAQSLVITSGKSWSRTLPAARSSVGTLAARLLVPGVTLNISAYLSKVTATCSSSGTASGNMFGQEGTDENIPHPATGSLEGCCRGGVSQLVRRRRCSVRFDPGTKSSSQ